MNKPQLTWFSFVKVVSKDSENGAEALRRFGQLTEVSRRSPHQGNQD